MIKPAKIAFDIDGVLADTMRLFLDILLHEYGINHLTVNDITSYELKACLDVDPEILAAANQAIIDGNYSGRLEPIADAGRVLRRLGAFGPIRLVTARPYPGPIKKWVDELLPPERYSVRISTTGSFDTKAEILKSEKIDFFVEDRLETCFLLQDYDITPVLFAQPWNRASHPFQEVHDWQQLEALIDWQ